jgi:hypothetical protein
MFAGVTSNALADLFDSKPPSTQPPLARHVHVQFAAGWHP